eukprot:4975544-Ditylum_brightwellii.AAC.1
MIIHWKEEKEGCQYQILKAMNIVHRSGEENEEVTYVLWPLIISLPLKSTVASASAPRAEGMDPVKVLFVKSNTSRRDNAPISG